MLTFYHAPRSRSTTVLALLHAMDALDRVSLQIVDIPRRDGSGQRDPANPHPEGKVPVLVHDGELIRETNAILVYLTDFFQSPLGRQVGQPGRGDYLSLMAWYGNVVEPVLVAQVAGVADNPAVQTTFRGVPEMLEVIESRLAKGPWLLGEDYSAVDLLVSAPFQLFKDMLPLGPATLDWAARSGAHPSLAWAATQDGPPPA
ncbi:glutathione S-transferase family protein [Mesobacterium pallidum]|uniref:glutathione S-transferase family protein n=1 Tax=Mesobacterium pallidum TaxID=2872037 RepID=UPI001EE3098F|nr:glutathione S-transferase family protein [Mesobacterium pallidum]